MMTLLRRDKNSKAGNESYADKRPVLVRSSFAISQRRAAEHAEWTRDSVAAHQQWMATQASAIWRIDQLS